jgi:hypothetical protein
MLSFKMNAPHSSERRIHCERILLLFDGRFHPFNDYLTVNAQYPVSQKSFEKGRKGLIKGYGADLFSEKWNTFAFMSFSFRVFLRH